MRTKDPIGGFIEVDVPPGQGPEELLELQLDQELEDVLGRLPASAGEALAPVRELLWDLVRRLLDLRAYTGISRLRLAKHLPRAAFLDHGHRANVSFEALTVLGREALFLVDYLNVLALQEGIGDPRLPFALTPLVHEVAALRASLDHLRASAPGNSRPLDRTLSLLGRAPLDPKGSARKLLGTFLERDDWRERDQVDLIVEHLDETVWDETPAANVLRQLRDSDGRGYENVVPGLISEARGCLGRLSLARKIFRYRSARGRRFIGPARFRGLVEALALALQLPAPTAEKLSARLARRPATECWQELEEIALRSALAEKRQLDLKNFEMASLYLLAEARPGDEGHEYFIRHLITDTDAYRRILATFYAAPEIQQTALLREIETFNRLPEHSRHPVQYQEHELTFVLKAVFLRPDVVQAIVHRERKKTLYSVLEGLGSRAYLPRLLHEVHNIFGYVTPEVFARITAALDLDPPEVIRVIASYKEFTADPKGHIIVYVCKGTACFLRGQPHISRTLSKLLGAERGQVSDQGIQYLEMDCFGVCHLAPVIKVGQSFLGNVAAEELPEIIATLLRGPTYANRVSFLNRISRMLAPGRILSLGSQLRVARAHRLPAELQGAGISLNAAGEVFPASPGVAPWLDPQSHTTRPLGTLVARSLSFDYPGYDGSRQVGSLVLDEAGQVIQLTNYPHSLLESEISKTIKPLARVEDGRVNVSLNGSSITLGEVNGNTVVIRRADGGFGSLTFAGEPCRLPPEEERGIPSRARAREPERFVARQDRLVLDFAPTAYPDSIDSYEAAGGYAALRRVLGLQGRRRLSPEEIVSEVSAAGLRGRGGAGFPTGRKWLGLLRARPAMEEADEVQLPLKLIVANGDEGDPGAFMDRTLVQERPHQLLEGMIIAALAVGARFGIIYLRKEYEDAVRRLENALFQARRRGYLGRNILGVEGVDFDIEIRLGAGAFVAGEKRAIMRAIEGKPAEPTLTAVSNTRRGLWGKPTLLNNVETFANIPLIMHRGGQWFHRQGHGDSGGSKIFSAAGIVKQTGLVEVRFGRTLRDIIEICGGIKEGKILAGVQIGGPSGAILSLSGIREYLLDAPLDFDTFNKVGAMLGSGGLVFLGEDDDVVRLARHFVDWLADESCGQCPACLQGTVSLGETLDAVLLGEAFSHHIHALWSKSDAIKAGSNCGLGRTAPNPVTSALRFFPFSFLHYILGNNRVNRLELFRSLEALHLLSREDISVISRRRRVVVGHIFTLRKRFMPTLYGELQRIDRHRPPQERRALHFLHLLGLEEPEVGRRDVSREYELEELQRHERRMMESELR
jgi:NADH:ubiquinone oxidoreductase subunit F (NADH-binding)/NADH:ubiquinone oxidoreductase subunit E